MDPQQDQAALVDPFKAAAPPPTPAPLVDPFKPQPQQMNPKEAQTAANSLVYSQLLNVPPSYAHDNHDAIKEALGDRMGGYLEAGDYGFRKESIVGEFWNKNVPAPFEGTDEVGHFIEGFGKMLADLPAYLAGSALGAVAGGAAGSVEVPGIGTIAGAAVGAGAGGFGLTAGMRQWLVDKYQKGNLSSFSEAMDILKATGKGALVGGTFGVAGEAAPLAEGIVGKIAGPRAYKAAAELAAMTTVGSLVEGKVPSAQDFVENAAMFLAMHVGTKGMEFAKSAAFGVHDRMQTTYAGSGAHPADVVAEAGKHSVENEPADNPTEILNRIDNEIQRIQPEPQEAAKPGEPAAKPAEKVSAPPQPASDGETGIKNATTEAEREERGLPEVEVETRRSFGKAFDDAKEQVDSGKIDPRELADELSKKPRALNAEESAALVYDRMRLQNEHSAIMDGIEEARAKGDTDAEDRQRERLTKVEDAINSNDEAARRTGYEQGLGLAARKMMLKQDYSLANTLQRARVASKDGMVSPELRDKLEGMTRQLEEANKRIDAYEEQKKQAHAQGIVEKIKRTEESRSRAAKRTETKEALKGEREVLYKQLNAELMGNLSANPMLNPKLYELFGKIAANHIRDGIVTIEGIVDEIHSNIQASGISKREIRDYISQYGRTIELSKDEIQVQLREARRQGRLLSALEDAKAKEVPLRSGLQRDKISARVKELQKQVDDAMRESGIEQDKTKSPEEQQRTSLASYKTRTETRIKEMQRRLDTGDFVKKPRKQLVLDQQAEDLKAQAEKIKSQVDDAIHKQKMAARNPVEKGAAMFQKWRRAVLLSSVQTLGKLQSAAMMRMGVTPIEELLGGVLSHVPGISQIADKAPREGGGLNISAEAKAFGQFFDKATYKDIASAAKTGKTSLDYLYGKKRDMPPEALDFFGHMHSAIKVLPKRSEFFRSLEKRAQWALDNHLDIQDPKVQSTIAADAYLDANRAIFMQENMVTKGYRMMTAYFESQGLSGKSVKFMLETVLPIVKVPSNFVAETFNYAAGAPKGGLEALSILLKKDGLKNLTMQQADNVLRSLKKGSLGLAILAVGYYAGGAKGDFQASGFYQPGDEKKKGKPEDLTIGGVEIPHWLQDSPVFLTLQMGATLRRVNDAYTIKGKSGGLIAGTTAASTGALKKVPFVGELPKLGESLRSADSTGLFVDDIIQSLLVPPDVRRIAQATDPSKSQRKPKNLEQSIEADIPGLRETVPTKKGKKFSLRGKR